MLALLTTLWLIPASLRAAQLRIASSSVACVLKCVNTWCTMSVSAGPEGDEEDMSDDGDDAGEDAPEDDVQDDAVHTFQGHSGTRLLALAEASAHADIACLAWRKCRLLHDKHTVMLLPQMLCSPWPGMPHRLGLLPAAALTIPCTCSRSAFWHSHMISMRTVLLCVTLCV